MGLKIQLNIIKSEIIWIQSKNSLIKNNINTKLTFISIIIIKIGINKINKTKIIQSITKQDNKITSNINIKFKIKLKYIKEKTISI